MSKYVTFYIANFVPSLDRVVKSGESVDIQDHEYERYNERYCLDWEPPKPEPEEEEEKPKSKAKAKTKKKTKAAADTD